MIDPRNMIKFNRSDDELVELLLYYILVAGKDADLTARKLQRLRNELDNLYPELDGDLHAQLQVLYIRDEYQEVFRKCKLGKYALLEKCLPLLSAYPPERLRADPPEELERIPGVGPKTSRIFVMQSRRGAQHAALDTHILRWMKRELGMDVPSSTPPWSPVYQRLEERFVEEANKRGKSPAELDLEIWIRYSDEYRMSTGGVC